MRTLGTDNNGTITLETAADVVEMAHVARGWFTPNRKADAENLRAMGLEEAGFLPPGSAPGFYGRLYPEGRRMARLEELARVKGFRLRFVHQGSPFNGQTHRIPPDAVVAWADETQAETETELRVGVDLAATPDDDPDATLEGEAAAAETEAEEAAREYAQAEAACHEARDALRAADRAKYNAHARVLAAGKAADELGIVCFPMVVGNRLVELGDRGASVRDVHVAARPSPATTTFASLRVGERFKVGVGRCVWTKRSADMAFVDGDPSDDYPYGADCVVIPQP